MSTNVTKENLQEFATKLHAKNKTLFATKAQVGSPLVASTVAGMTDTDKIYVYTGTETGYTAGNWYYYDGSEWASGGVYNAEAVETDTTLSTSGMAADAKAVGDEFAKDLWGVPLAVREAIYTLLNSAAYATTGLEDEIAVVETWAEEVYSLTLSADNLSLTGSTPQALIPTVVPATASITWSSSDTSIATVVGGVVTGVSNGSCVITASAGSLSANCAVTVSGFATLESISAVYTQSGSVYTDDSLDYLKDDLVVTATYSDTTEVVLDSSAYTLGGTLTAGTSAITVVYGGKSTSFNVTVTASNVPDGYKRVDYLYSNATDTTHGVYIATAASFSNPTTAEYTAVFQVESGSSVNGHIMCTKQKNTGSSNLTGFELITNESSSNVSAWSGTPGAVLPLEDMYAKYTITAIWKSGEMSIQNGSDTPVTNSQTTRAIGGYPICLFGNKPATASSGSSYSYYFFRGKIYYAEAKQDGTKILECYPCVRESDNAVGMYDVVNDSFKTGYSIGSGMTLTAGRD